MQSTGSRLESGKLLETPCDSFEDGPWQEKIDKVCLITPKMSTQIRDQYFSPAAVMEAADRVGRKSFSLSALTSLGGIYDTPSAEDF